MREKPKQAIAPRFDLDLKSEHLTGDFSELISRFIDRWSEQNQIPQLWRTPLVAIAAANDPLFPQLREAVAADHLIPSDLLPEAKSILVYFLPFVQELGKENKEAGFFAAKSWAEAYVATNQLIGEINRHIEQCLNDRGYQAAVTPATHNFDQERLLSRWSHKHIAYVAGLGTFGHHHLIITEAGCCGRLGSLVTNVPISATERPGREYCLTRAGHKCLACAGKCTYGALGETAFDRHACYRQLLENDRHYSDLPLVDVCGKCGCEVPCSYGIPNKLRAQTTGA